MIKECALCGMEFESNVAIRKYCPNCSKLSDRKRNYVMSDIEKKQEKYDAFIRKPKIFEGDCDNCGKHIKKEYRYVWKRRPDLNGPLYYFCTEKCMREFMDIYSQKEASNEQKKENSGV